MLWELINNARDLPRVQEIAAVLVRHGFGDLVHRLGLGRVLEGAGRLTRRRGAREFARLEPAQRVRRALEELGPTFIKLGQLLSTRVDLFPADWIAEFEKLLDDVPAVPFDDLREQLTKDLGAAPEDVFDDLETEALAGGSIAQVHRARLPDGTPVVLKIRRPGIEATVEADLRLFGTLAAIAENEIAELRRFRPVEIFKRLKQTITAELDLSREGRNARRIAAQFPPDSALVVPKVYPEWTSQRLNVQQYIEGIPGRDVDEARRQGLDLPKLARVGARSVLQMVLETGFFHSDPHPGNVFLLSGNRLALIDFGMVGRLSPRRRDEVIDLLFALVERDSERASDVLCAWDDDATVAPERLAAEIAEYLDEYHDLPLKDVPIGEILADVLGLLRAHDLTLPADLSLLFKILLTLETFGCQLDPEFNLAAESRPFLERAMRRRYSPRALSRRSWKATRRLVDLFTTLPDDLGELIGSARRGRLQLRVRVTDLERLSADLSRAANRTTVGLVTSALIVGTAIAMTVDRGPRLFDLPVFGFLGFVSSFVAGVWLLGSIWRSGRAR